MQRWYNQQDRNPYCLVMTNKQEKVEKESPPIRQRTFFWGIPTKYELPSTNLVDLRLEKQLMSSPFWENLENGGVLSDMFDSTSQNQLL